MKGKYILKLVAVLIVVVLIIGILYWRLHQINWYSDTLLAEKLQPTTLPIQDKQITKPEITEKNIQPKTKPVKADVADSNISDIKKDQIFNHGISTDLDEILDAYELAFGRWPTTDMTPDRQEKAVEIFLRERDMWERLKGLDGDIEIHAYIFENGNEQEVRSIQGRIHIETTEPDEEAIEQNRIYSFYKISIIDPNGQWKYLSDGSVQGTQFSCQDNTIHAILRSWLSSPAIPHGLSLPRISLLDGPESQLYATKYFGDDRALWRHPKCKNDLDSFMYKHHEGDGDYTTKIFERGHFGRYEKIENGKTSWIEYKNYKGRDDQNSFPTEIIINFRSITKLKLNFSNLNLNFE